MNTKNSFLWRTVLAGCFIVALGSCGGGLSDVGEQENLPPTAVAGVVGYNAANANGEVTADVRAGTQVLLTGKDSVEADKPILSYLWEADNAAAGRATIIVRSTNTIAVNVPSEAQTTDMRFRLTVRDSDGDEDDAIVTLHVQPRLDSDRFLQYVNNVPKLRIVAGTSPHTAAGAFTVSIRGHLTYTTRSGASNTINYDIGSPTAGNWLAGGASADQGAVDPRNPFLEFPMPAVDLDRVTRQLQQSLPGSAPQMADPAFVDDASLALTITLTPTTATSNATVYLLAANSTVVAQSSNGGTGAPAILSLTAAQLQELHITGGGLENEATADSYYSAIDPNGTKLTLRQWLTENCFNPTASDLGADAHAVYVNNFDLGFGRDMYFRTTRPAGCTSASFENGDVASVVINYPTLEAAAKKIAPFIAVAMEYEAVDANHSAPGRVTFYTYAPDEGTGEMRRVKSANFDGRGEKYLPGACTTCHGGRPRTPAANRSQTYVAEADTNIGATFMPWDLESFLFSDTDPNFPHDSSNAALRESLTRARQEAQFKLLNLAARSTYGSGSGNSFACHAPFGGACELVELWYGGTGVPNATFRDRQVAPGWAPGGANPATSGDIYLDVYARNCRSCHTQRVIADNANADPQFRTYGEFTQAANPPWRTRLINQVFQIGGMPAARLTMDRFWTRLGGANQSAGELLAQHLGVPAATRPGAATACSISTPTLGTSSTSRVALARNGQVSVDAACSQFASAYRWTLAAPTGSTSSAQPNLSTRTAFSLDRPGDYDLTLQVTGPAGDVSTLVGYATVVNNVPVAGDFAIAPDLGASATTTVLNSPAAIGDAPAIVSIVSASSGLEASVDVNQNVVIRPTTLQGGSVVYRITDVDGDAANSDTGTIAVTVNAEISVSSPSVSVAANSSDNQIPLTVSSLSQPVTVTPGTSTATNLGGTFQVVTCGNTYCARYTPPSATTSLFGSIRVRPADTFQYTACFAAQPTNCDTGLVTVDINGVSGFQDVANRMRTTCASCHNPGGAASTTWTIPVANATNRQAWCAVRFRLATDEVVPVGQPQPPLVNPANPAASLLYRKPSGDLGHVTFLDMTQAAPILNWITEGGAYTGDINQTTGTAAQTCPP